MLFFHVGCFFLHSGVFFWHSVFLILLFRVLCFFVVGCYFFCASDCAFRVAILHSGMPFFQSGVCFCIPGCYFLRV